MRFAALLVCVVGMGLGCAPKPTVTLKSRSMQELTHPTGGPAGSDALLMRKALEYSRRCNGVRVDGDEELRMNCAVACQSALMARDAELANSQQLRDVQLLTGQSGSSYDADAGTVRVAFLPDGGVDCFPRAP